MTVEVRLFATLRDYLPPESVDGVYHHQLEGTSTARQLATQLNLPFPDIHLIMVNGVQSNLDTEIKSGDRVGFFPPVGGG